MAYNPAVNNMALYTALMLVYMDSYNDEPEKISMAEYNGEADFIRLDNMQVVDAGSLAIAHYDDNHLRLYLDGTTENVKLRRGEVKDLFERLQQRDDFIELTDDVLCDTDRICLLDLSKEASKIYLPHDEVTFKLNNSERKAAFDAMHKDDAFLCYDDKAVRIGAIIDSEYDNGELVLSLFNGEAKLQMSEAKAMELVAKIAENNGFADFGKGRVVNLNIASAISKLRNAIRLEFTHNDKIYEIDNDAAADLFYDISNRKGFVPLGDKDIINIHGVSFIEFSKKYVDISYAAKAKKRVRLDAAKMDNFKKALSRHDKFVALTDDAIVNVNNLQSVDRVKNGVSLNFPNNDFKKLKLSDDGVNDVFASLGKVDKFFSLPINEGKKGVVNLRALLRAEFRESGWFSKDRLYLKFDDESINITMDKETAKKAIAGIIASEPHMIDDGRGALNARGMSIVSAGRNMLSYSSGDDWNWYRNEDANSMKALDNMLKLKAVEVEPKDKPADNPRL